ncbi:transglutaminase [Siphonobacter sp. BAB-5385]|uniref:transglutaminase family protein n=1 Tax=Siphonobacter sp. BAB-5385 TaxID=1864822 RepID=UPI000B9DD176|nr:transglutaminase family protein [Siphonobacter sp. BAB-5385]OZI08325.1 transglutaminase [Siphonobacter sp. BAB-5385]
MQYRVRHQLTYNYSNAVTLSPHRLYLQARSSSYQQIKSIKIQVSPEPDKMIGITDSEGNTQHLLFFSTPTTQLQILAESEIESKLSNPFDFILYPFEHQKLPIKYSDEERRLLTLYLEKEGITPAVEQFTRLIATESRWDTLQFLIRLNECIHEEFSYEIREEGFPQTPDYTLQNRRGSCRDYATLYVTCCQCLGLAARFVSGYYFGNADETQYLHAWAEVYLPGAGWRGFDPTQNCLAADSHLVLAVSAFPEMISPVHGTYTGPAESALETSVEVVPSAILY